MTTIQMLKARIENIERYVFSILPPTAALDFNEQKVKIWSDFETVGHVPEKQEEHYEAKYQRLVEIEKAHQEQISKLVAENKRLNEALKKWGIYGKR